MNATKRSTKTNDKSARTLPDPKGTADKFLCDLIRLMIEQGTVTATVNIDVERDGLMGAFEVEVALRKYNGQTLS